MIQEDIDQDILAVVIVIVSFLFLFGKEKKKKHDSEMSGAMYCEYMLNHENEKYFHEMFRMDRPCFIALVNKLTQECGLEESHHVTASEKLMIFIFIISGSSYSKTCDRFQHSGSTVTKIVHEVARSLFNNGNKFLVKPTLTRDGIEKLMEPKYRPFRNCVGALDGSHIMAVIPTKEQKLFRDRKGNYMKT
jgi:hypothetical protein